MPPRPAIADALAALARALDGLHEADVAANPGGLLADDRGRAVSDIETALTATLDAFGRLCRAVDAQFPDVPIDWYGAPELAFVLALDTARGRAGPPRPRSIYTWHADTASRPSAIAQYVLVDFEYAVERADAFDVFLSWRDLEDFFALPSPSRGLGAETVEAIREYLGSAHFPHYAAHHGLADDHVFFNVVPLLVNAGAALALLLAPLVEHDAAARKLLGHRFASAAHADTSRPQILCGPFLLPA
ncbi:MAG: hypothetical protein RLW61_21025 [Gammaproteobacteria bacterium]